MPDPHSTDYSFVKDPEALAMAEEYVAVNNAAYELLKDTGIEFRGWRFWPPFFCMTCGIAINTKQWLFARICGGCDCSAGARAREHGITFAGRCELINAKESVIQRILDPRSEEGKTLSAAVQTRRKRLPRYMPHNRPIDRYRPMLPVRKC